MVFSLRRRWAMLAYHVRWWRWFLFTGHWPTRTLYSGPYRLDKESRRLIIERVESEKAKHEPMRPA
jgi:hypothetical protein